MNTFREITSSDQVTETFSLTCLHCDAGMNIESFDEAIKKGWVDIVEAFDFPEANYMGLCPDCQELQV